MGTITIFDKSELSLADTLECGQVFRYRAYGKGYEVFSLDKRAYAYDDGDCIKIESADTEYFGHYFDLYRDYRAVRASLSEFSELGTAMECGKGIRLLRQDPFEMMISFIVSANNNIPRIKKIIEAICDMAGKNMGEYRAFPTRDELLGMTEADFAACGAGYRAPYLAAAVRTASEEFIRELAPLPTEEVRKRLLSVSGIGPKVADCILLFGLARWDTFPVDTWMIKALKESDSDTGKKIRARYLEKYGRFAGLAQQYIFHWKRNTEGKTDD